ncbi:hypothetical protein OQI_16960 [Streptomyces pharetrae CZA14]|uniref:Uncharacterized protein n=1 Tax=Streptomyces pharetrae CZA14 TaxID=1144883 RepID=A0ABX3YHJ8_9ACTN|nr:hypothetical protein OQI_16960 [Streptomyces pharetrae CZA14]
MPFSVTAAPGPPHHLGRPRAAPAPTPPTPPPASLPDGPERDRVRDEVLRAVLHLRFFEDWPQTRIAGRPGISQTLVSRPLGRTCARPRHETPCPRQQETGHGGSSTTSRSPAAVRTS